MRSLLITSKLKWEYDPQQPCEKTRVLAGGCSHPQRDDAGSVADPATTMSMSAGEPAHVEEVGLIQVTLEEKQRIDTNVPDDASNCRWLVAL